MLKLVGILISSVNIAIRHAQDEVLMQGQLFDFDDYCTRTEVNPDAFIESSIADVVNVAAEMGEHQALLLKTLPADADEIAAHKEALEGEATEETGDSASAPSA